ncbi:hypothetical protein D3C71_1486720 [compost metagenome]
METIASMIDHENNVSFTLRPKYSLNSQNPASLTWENIRLPAPIANTIRLGSAFPPVTIGSRTPAAVKAATVAEPTQPLITAVINQANSKGEMGSCCRVLANNRLTPLSSITCLKIPEPAIINRIMAISFTADS